MGWQLTALDAIAETLSLIPSTYLAAYNCL